MQAFILISLTLILYGILVSIFIGLDEKNLRETFPKKKEMIALPVKPKIFLPATEIVDSIELQKKLKEIANTAEFKFSSKKQKLTRLSNLLMLEQNNLEKMKRKTKDPIFLEIIKVKLQENQKLKKEIARQN